MFSPLLRGLGGLKTILFELKTFYNQLKQMKRFLNYNKKLNQRAKELRKNMTVPEQKLWKEFLEEINNTKFRVLKQKQIDQFIVDFYISKRKLVIEIDWESHFDKQWIAYDKDRTNILKWLNLKVVRFTNEEVINNFEKVCLDLENEFSL